MHAAVSDFLYQFKKSLFLSSGALSHFWLSELCFFYQFAQRVRKKGGFFFFFFVLAISELNFIPPPFAWNGRRQR